MKFLKELIKGLWKENPIFRLVLGMCRAEDTAELAQII